MANALGSNHGTKVVKKFAEQFETQAVLSKMVRPTSGAEGLDSDTGDTYYIKRPHLYKAIRTSGGDISSETPSDITSGRIAVTKQDYITTYLNWTDVEQALEMNQLEQILAPAAEEIITELELSLGQFMIENSGLSYGTPGQALNNWNEVSGAAALLKSIGAPMLNSSYVMNPFGQSNLAGVQNGLNAASDLVKSAWENATISKNVGGIAARTSSALNTFQSGATADRAGTLAATPIQTYAGAKDTMIATLSLTGLTASTTDAVRAGDIIEFTGTGNDARSHVNARTRKVIMGSDGAPVPFRCVVVTGGDTSGAGAVTVTVAGAPIFESAAGTGAYNNISAALASGDAFTILGAAGTTYQPNLFFAKEAFILDTVKIPKLEAQDVNFKTMSGFQLRMSRGSSLLANTHQLRIDLVPGFGCANPLMAGKGFGLA